MHVSNTKQWKQLGNGGGDEAQPTTFEVSGNQVLTQFGLAEDKVSDNQSTEQANYYERTDNRVQNDVWM